MGKTSSVLGTFLLGGIIGAAAGLLFAPRTGRETREYLSDKAVEYWDRADEFYEVGRERAADVYEVGRERALEMYEIGLERAASTGDQVRTKIDAARERLIESLPSDGTVAAEPAPEKVEPASAPAAKAEPAPAPEPTAKPATA